MTNKDKATARPWQIASVTSSHMGNVFQITDTHGEINEHPMDSVTDDRSIAIVFRREKCKINNDVTMANAKLIVKAVNIHDKLISTLETIKTDCKMALSGDWDRSDEGFQAIIESINAVLKE